MSMIPLSFLSDKTAHAERHGVYARTVPGLAGELLVGDVFEGLLHHPPLQLMSYRWSVHDYFAQPTEAELREHVMSVARRWRRSSHRYVFYLITDSFNAVNVLCQEASAGCFVSLGGYNPFLMEVLQCVGAHVLSKANAPGSMVPKPHIPVCEMKNALGRVGSEYLAFGYVESTGDLYVLCAGTTSLANSISGFLELTPPSERRWITL